MLIAESSFCSVCWVWLCSTLYLECGNDSVTAVYLQAAYDLLPGMDGLAAIARIRQQPALAKIPIVALTALALEGGEC
jgi:CheY-like chemotaxis protein